MLKVELKNYSLFFLSPWPYIKSDNVIDKRTQERKNVDIFKIGCFLWNSFIRLDWAFIILFYSLLRRRKSGTNLCCLRDQRFKVSRKRELTHSNIYFYFFEDLFFTHFLIEISQKYIIFTLYKNKKDIFCYRTQFFCTQITKNSNIEQKMLSN